MFPGNQEIVDVLIKSGANVNVKDNERKSPLHWAAIYGILKKYLKIFENIRSLKLYSRLRRK